MKKPQVNITKKQLKRASTQTRFVVGQAVLAAGFMLYIAEQLQPVFAYGQYLAIPVAFLVLYFTNKR